MRTTRLTAIGACALGLAVAAPAAHAATATITPVQLTANKATNVTLTAKACQAPELLVNGAVLENTGQLTGSHGVFTGVLRVLATAKNGKTSLSLRCSGGALGSVTVTIVGGRKTGGSSGSGSSGSKGKAPAGTFVARIGWFYTDEPDQPQSVVPNQVKISWPACVKAGGTSVYFPSGQHIYPYASSPTAIKKKIAIATISGPALDPSDKFNTSLYVGDLATEGSRDLTLKCEHLVHGSLVTAFTGPLKTKFVRQDNTFFSASNPISNYEAVLNGPVTDVSTVNRSCNESGTPSETLTSQAIAPNAQGQRSVTLTRDPATLNDFQSGSYSGTIAKAPDVGSGTYPVTVSCGTGRVGVGTIKVL